MTNIVSVYEDIKSSSVESKEDNEVKRLKFDLLRKDILHLNYKIQKDVEGIQARLGGE